SMRLGADVVVFSRCTRDRKLTQSVGLLSYTFLMQTRQDRIVVPMVDYEFDKHSRTWKTLHSDQQLQSNLSILLQWSPFTTEAELLKQCDDIGRHGTKIIVYNLWHNDEGKMELDFDSDPEDICISGKGNKSAKLSSRMEASEQHLANRLHYSLRGSVITTIGFLKEAPAVNIHGFNVYHKNRLILPFWHVVTYSDSRGRGVVGKNSGLELSSLSNFYCCIIYSGYAVFVAHARDAIKICLCAFLKFGRDYHCGLIGYQVKKKPQPTMMPHLAKDSRQVHGVYQPVLLGRDSSATPGIPVTSSHRNSQGAPLKRKANDGVGPERVKKMVATESRTVDGAHGGEVQHAVDPAKQLECQEAAHIIQENQKLRARCQEYEKMDEELNAKITRLMTEVREAHREHARLLLESKLLEKVKQEHRQIKPV
ncbi:protein MICRORCHIDIA 6, partial [Sesamum angolense]